MTDQEMLALAREMGFSAALTEITNVPTDPSFRQYCRENLCGQYGVNYGCPPDCGTPEELRQTLLKHSRALVLQTAWPISDDSDRAAVARAKARHNSAQTELMDRLAREGHRGTVVGSSGCTVCETCACAQGKPCIFPARRYACMSAYCVFVMGLARVCDLRYDGQDGMLRLFGMLLLV